MASVDTLYGQLYAEAVVSALFFFGGRAMHGERVEYKPPSPTNLKAFLHVSTEIRRPTSLVLRLQKVFNETTGRAANTPIGL